MSEPNSSNIADKILSALNDEAEVNVSELRYPWLQRILKATFRVGVLVFIVWFLFFRSSPGTSLEGLEEYREMIIEDHNRSMRIEKQLELIQNRKDERTVRIKRDSTIILSSDRHYRDSLRAIHNPR